MLPPLEILPHRPPFLFVDEVLACDQKRVHATRVFRPEEDFFRGHYPGRPIVPGVILIEALAQAFAYWAMTQLQGRRRVYLVGVDRARFRRPVVPGERVDLVIDVEGTRHGLTMGTAEARVGDAVVAEAKLTGKLE